MARICSIAVDPTLLRVREHTLAAHGHTVVSLAYEEGRAAVCTGNFDVLILGARIPHEDKLALISDFRATNPPAQVVVLGRPGERRIPGVDYLHSGDPEELVGAITRHAAKRHSA